MLAAFFPSRRFLFLSGRRLGRAPLGSIPRRVVDAFVLSPIAKRGRARDAAECENEEVVLGRVEETPLRGGPIAVNNGRIVKVE